MTPSEFPNYIDYFQSIFLPFLRVGALLMTFPIISTKLVPKYIRLILAVTMTYSMLPSIPEYQFPKPMTLEWLIIAVKEILIGVILGYSVQLLFQLLVIGGQTIAMQSGLGFAQLMDPVNGVSVASISQIYLLMANIFFFSIGGHISIIQTLSQTFIQMPIGLDHWPIVQGMNIVYLASWMFSSGLLMALPAVVALLMINFTFGVISRLAPQFNVFSFGFAFIVLSGIVIVMITVPRILPLFTGLTFENLQLLKEYFNV